MNVIGGLLHCVVDGHLMHVDFFGKSALMNQATFIRLLLDWLPFMFFIGMMLYFLRKTMPRQKNHMDANQKYMNEHLAEIRRMNETLERVATALEKKSPAER